MPDTFVDLIDDNALLQPLEVVKTTMAANRKDSFGGALSRVWGRGGVLGCELYLVKALDQQWCTD